MNKKKNGWGLAMMIVYMSVLLVFLLITVIMVYNFYNNNERVTKENKEITPQFNSSSETENILRRYRVYENRIKQNAITYIYTYYINLSDEYTKVTVEDMQNKGLMDAIIDPQDGSVCSGYAKLRIENNKIISIPYLKCNNYESDGYE